jgi:YHS domain-containing protein
MGDLNELERRIKEKLASTEERKQVLHNHIEQRMLETEQRHQRYTAIADRLMSTILRPRMEKLAQCFENAKLPEAEQAGRHHCLCSFSRTDRFPATTKFELAVSHDSLWQNLLVLYNLEILPIFFQFKERDQLLLPLDRVEDAQVAAWVEEKILYFVDTYLRLETVEQYQQDNLVTDPVCGMQINKAYAGAEMEYAGRPYYFCLEECKTKFAADPVKYLPGGRQ